MELINDENNETNETNETNELLDNEWILQFEKSDNLYKDFYKDKIYYINFFFIYINQNNEIDKINSQPILLSTPNYITKEEIIKNLKKYTTEQNKHYSLSSILKYNISLNTDDVIPFLKCNSKDLDYYTKKFLTPININNIENAIYFENTIAMFHDLNDLFFLFNEVANKNTNTNQNTKTKKNNRLLSTSRKKTIKHTSVNNIKIL